MLTVQSKNTHVFAIFLFLFVAMTMLNGFIKIGQYIPGEPQPEYISFIGRNKTKKIPIVYLFVIGVEIVYVGESRRGYSRPLSYHKNKTMARQRLGIVEANNNNQTVDVYAIEVPNVYVQFNEEEFLCYVAQDYEKFLIKKFKPPWNGRH